MAQFEKAFHFERFVPNLGNNRALPPHDQLALLLATGMTKVDLIAFGKGLSEAFKAEPLEPPAAGLTPEAHAEALATLRLDRRSEVLAEQWAPYAKLERGGHSIEGRAVSTLRDYVRALGEQRGMYGILELRTEVQRLNSIEGTAALFSDAPSGSSASTGDPSGAAKTGGR